MSDRNRNRTSGNEGEIIMKTRYRPWLWNKPEETAGMFRDGWLYTGDLGIMDEEGYIKLLGRSRELIKCSGYSVFPAGVEDLLYRHPAIKKVVVNGVNDHIVVNLKGLHHPETDYVGKGDEQRMLSGAKIIWQPQEAALRENSK